MDIFKEIGEVFEKADYKITSAVFDENTKSISIKAKSNVTPAIFPNMEMYKAH